MKVKKVFAGVVASLAVATSMFVTTTASAASSKRLPNVWQYGQNETYWCGYAAMQSAINNEYRNGKLSGNYNKEWKQTEVANYMRDNYGMYPYDNVYHDGSLAWYTGSKNVDSDQIYYPAGKALTSLKAGFTWIAYGPSTTGNSSLDASTVKSKIVSTLNGNHAVLACGRSNPNGSSYFPNYPKRMIYHWICSDGYEDDGNQVWVVDPAAQGAGGSGFENVPRYYKVSIQKFTDFAWYHGIIY